MLLKNGHLIVQKNPIEAAILLPLLPVLDKQLEEMPMLIFIYLPN